MKNLEKEKIVKLLEFLSNNAKIEFDEKGIFINNFEYDTFIKLEGLPDGSFKVEFAVRNEKNPFRKLGENKGESFVLPYDMISLFLETLTDEINVQRNNQIIEESGKLLFNQKMKEVYNILNSEIKVEEEYQNYVICYESELFNNVMTIDKFKDNRELLHHDFISLNYTYLVEFKDENDGRDPTYKTQKIQLFIPTIKIKDFKLLNKLFEEPKQTNINTLINILQEVNQNEKMSKLLTFTNLSVNLEVKEKVKNKKI